MLGDCGGFLGLMLRVCLFLLTVTLHMCVWLWGICWRDYSTSCWLVAWCNLDGSVISYRCEDSNSATMIIVTSLLFFEVVIVSLELLQECPVWSKLSLVIGMLARKRLPMSSSAGERPHHGKGVVRYTSRAKCGSFDSFLLSGLFVQPVHCFVEIKDCWFGVEIVCLCKFCKFRRWVLRVIITNHHLWDSQMEKVFFNASMIPWEVVLESRWISGYCEK